jgi:hypothetical protein
MVSSSLSAKINLVFAIMMVLVYLAMGTFILLFDFNLLSGMNPDIKNIFGFLLIAYALYRLYRVIKIIREKTDENTSETN